MAQFRIGEEAKIVGCTDADWVKCNGEAVTILALPESDPYGLGRYRVSTPKFAPIATPSCFCKQRHLAPRVDEAADAFLARMKKLGSEPVNDAPKVKVEVEK